MGCSDYVCIYLLQYISYLAASDRLFSNHLSTSLVLLLHMNGTSKAKKKKKKQHWEVIHFYRGIPPGIGYKWRRFLSQLSSHGFKLTCSPRFFYWRKMEISGATDGPGK